MSHLLLAVLLRRRRRRLEQALQQLLLLRLRLSIRSRHYLTRASLIDPQMSPWHQMDAERDRMSFINLLSIDPSSFDDLFSFFERFYVFESREGSRGRPPSVDKRMALAILLEFYCAPIERKTLCSKHGITPSTLSRLISKGEKALELALQHIRDARISMPSKPVQRAWATITQHFEPNVSGVFAFLDGKNYRVQQPSAVDLQNAMYNGNL
jgi:hypothetical protein